MTVDPLKYIVFNRAEYNAGGQTEIEDAVVIRKRDTFAHIGLNAYAGAMLTTIDVLEDLGEPAFHLVEIADYMSGQADESRRMITKLPDL